MSFVNQPKTKKMKQHIIQIKPKSKAKAIAIPHPPTFAQAIEKLIKGIFSKIK